MRLHGVAVIVLAVPSQAVAKDFAFVVGEPRATEVNALVAALEARGVTRAATIADDATVPLATGAGVELLPPIDCSIDPPPRARRASRLPSGSAIASARGWSTARPSARAT